MSAPVPSTHALMIAIRTKCLDCSGGVRKMVEQCNIKDCPLYPYRSIKAMGGSAQPGELTGQMDFFEILKREA